MNLEIELLGNALSEAIKQYLLNSNINYDVIADTVSIKVLSEIQQILKNDCISDFDAIEQIICVFEKYNLDFGSRHDFGWWNNKYSC